jgi:hypothetical protein
LRFFREPNEPKLAIARRISEPFRSRSPRPCIH